MRPRILVTGFGPFPDMPFNASAALVRHLADEAQLRGARVRLDTAILPTSWRKAPSEAAAYLERLKPDAVVHFGVSSRATGFHFETRAANARRDAADCDGLPPGGYYAMRGGVPYLAATLPAEALVRRLRLAGLPACISRDAGRYLCNATLYHTLYIASRAPSVHAPLAGFIHIPALPDDGTSAVGAGLGWAELRRGASEILRGLAAHLLRRGYEDSRIPENRLRIGSVRRRAMA